MLASFNWYFKEKSFNSTNGGNGFLSFFLLSLWTPGFSLISMFQFPKIILFDAQTS